MNEQIYIRGKIKEFTFDLNNLIRYSTFFKNLLDVTKQTHFKFTEIDDEVIKYLQDFIEDEPEDYQLKDFKQGISFAKAIGCKKMETQLEKEAECFQYFEEFKKEGKLDIKSLNCDIEDLIGLAGHYPEMLKYLQEEQKKCYILDAIFKNNVLRYWQHNNEGEFNDHMIQAGHDFFINNPKKAEEEVIRTAQAYHDNLDIDLVKQDLPTFCRDFIDVCVQKYVKKEKEVIVKKRGSTKKISKVQKVDPRPRNNSDEEEE